NVLDEHLWFVSVLLVCYLLFPLLNRQRAWALAGAAMVFVILSFSGSGAVYRRISTEPALRLGFHLIPFCAGAWLAEIKTRFRPGGWISLLGFLGFVSAYGLLVRFAGTNLALNLLGAALALISA